MGQSRELPESLFHMTPLSLAQPGSDPPSPAPLHSWDAPCDGRGLWGRPTSEEQLPNPRGPGGRSFRVLMQRWLAAQTSLTAGSRELLSDPTPVPGTHSFPLGEGPARGSPQLGCTEAALAQVGLGSPGPSLSILFPGVDYPWISSAPTSRGGFLG